MMLPGRRTTEPTKDKASLAVTVCSRGRARPYTIGGSNLQAVSTGRTRVEASQANAPQHGLDLLMAQSLALYIILWNYLETLWMRGFEFLWVVFLIIAAEAARYWQPFPVTRAASRSKPLKTGSPGLSRGARRPSLRIST
jgi:hypothetical protein